FFAERRPFFLEGGDLFRIPADVNNGTEGAFYTRRIGAAPTVEPPDYQYLQQPTATTIYGAAKVTGKSRGWSVGVLDAVTGQETATIVDADGERQEPIVAPLTNYMIARVKRDWRKGKTSLGLSGTAVNRSLADTGLADLFHDQAYTAGSQLSHRFAKNNAWELQLSLLGSLVHGTEAAIAQTQLSQRHLFQRPDTFRFDPERTSLVGGAASWSFGQSGNTKHWRYGTAGGITTPGLELNDAGFQRNSDLLISSFYGQYHDEAPSDHVLNYSMNLTTFWVQTAEPRLTDVGIEGRTNVQLANYWTSAPAAATTTPSGTEVRCAAARRCASILATTATHSSPPTPARRCGRISACSVVATGPPTRVTSGSKPASRCRRARTSIFRSASGGRGATRPCNTSRKRPMPPARRTTCSPGSIRTRCR
ncbi:MAG: hypothetical protein H0V17_17020, partial [Deltaproteobacteria bacterium]|nr:hypothetical protein [Deltaproteobacteria bacterium]